jgi:hypothetical protein
MQRIEEHRTLTAERQIRKLYSEMLKDLQGFIGVEYAKFADDDRLTYSTLAQKGEYARFLREVQAKVSKITPNVDKAITDVVKDVYRVAYEGMVKAVSKSVNDTELTKLLGGIHLTQPQVIKAAVNNPIAKLTLSDTLKKNRKQIIYNIKQTVTVGIMNGDRMSTMARKIKNDVDQNYRKAMLIARTEVHRVRETGHNDASQSIDDALANADSEYRMVKTWKSMRDSAVRKTNKADHRKMDGQTVLQHEEFDLGNVKAQCPSQTGKAYHDCNCRCYVSHDLMSDEEFFKATGRHFPQVKKPKTTEKAKQENKKPKTTAKSTAKPKKTVEPTPIKQGGLSADNFPTAFNQRTAKKQTQKFVDYVNSLDNADSDMISIYSNIGKMENIESRGIPFKVSYTKKNHSVGAKTSYGGKLTEANIKIPKLDGDNITGAAQTTAHELAHYIDFLMREDADKYGNWISITGDVKNAIETSRVGISDKISNLFKEANEKYKEVRANVKKKYNAMLEKLDVDNADIIENKYTNTTAYNKYVKEYNALIKEMEEILDYESRNVMDGVNSLQDIYDALSKGRYRDTGVVIYGHGIKYYQRMDSQIHEIWANYCALSLTRPDLIDLLREDKPELVKALEEIKAKILKKVGEM